MLSFTANVLGRIDMRDQSLNTFRATDKSAKQPKRIH